MIPKIIHYCWFGRGEKSDLILKCIDSWKKYCPDYEIIEWNEDNFDVDFCDYSHDAYQAKISYFYRSCHTGMFCTFSVHSDDILTNRSQKHLQNQAFCCQ